MERAGYSLDRKADGYARVAKLIEERLRATAPPEKRDRLTVSPKYLAHFLGGWQRPSWDLAKAMAQLTDGTVSAVEIIEFKRPPRETEETAA